MIPPKRKIVIETYSNEWSQQFENEKRRIQNELGNILIEHIGSTSVQGLDAKPVIDMMAIIPSLKEIYNYIEKMKQLGYIYYPELETQIPDRRFFQRRIDDMPRYHISFTEPMTDYHVRHLLFRDYLRKHPHAADTYAALKKQLAEEYIDDFDAYNAGKSNLIALILSKAREEIQ